MKILLLTNVSINNPFVCHAKGTEVDTDEKIANELVDKGYATEVVEPVKKTTRKKAIKSTDATATTDSESQD